MSQAKILIVEDDASLREVLNETLGIAGYDMVLAEDGEQALQRLRQHDDIALVLSDVQMQPMDGNALLSEIRKDWPNVPVLLMTAYGTVEHAVKAIHLGASDYLVKPFEAQELIDKVAEHIRESAAQQTEQGLIAEDARSKQLALVAQRVAATEATVLLTGESGVGKEVVSRYIHQHSARANGPFVAINCAAIPENMLESVLFGYEKGAFTGAYQSKPGKFEQAQGGTLLLDEITEMHLGLQAKLLRVLQEREVERLGGRKPIALDVRILATTNRDIRQAVAEGKFREDLYYRLNVFPIQLAPLRERRDDILPLARQMLAKYTEGMVTPRLSSAAMTALTTHDWPGNVRELDNVIQRALILRSGDLIDAPDIRFETVEPIQNTQQTDATPAGNSAPRDLNMDMKTHERELIISALRTKASRKEVADTLGISPRTLRYKLAKLRDAGVALPA